MHTASIVPLPRVRGGHKRWGCGFGSSLKGRRHGALAGDMIEGAETLATLVITSGPTFLSDAAASSSSLLQILEALEKY
nr:hypothetical protein Iba_chr03bCG3830 [Ipomoea batatas]